MAARRKAKGKKRGRTTRRRSRKSPLQKWFTRSVGMVKQLIRIVQAFASALSTLLRGIVATLRWWWGLPRWLKFGKVLAVIAMAIGFPLIDAGRQWLQYREVYVPYYDHFYATYIQQTTHREADYYASYYADYYAKYYTSPSYRESLRYALPSATPETLAYPTGSPVASLRTSPAGLALIKQFEGIRLKPYADAGGKLTIGYGHLIKPGEYFTALNETQAHAMLKEDVQVAEAYIKRYVKVPLRENQFAALVSLVYNIGPNNFKKSTLLNHLNDGKAQLASEEFLRWDKVNGESFSGLARRREAEKRLFES